MTITLYVKRNEAQPGGGPWTPQRLLADSGVKVDGAGRQLDLPTTRLCLCFKLPSHDTCGFIPHVTRDKAQPGGRT